MFLFPVLILTIIFSDRIVQHLVDLLIIFEDFPYIDFDRISGFLSGQVNNIFPIFELMKNDYLTLFFKLMIGNKMGSSLVVNFNTRYWPDESYINPHTMITRLVYENGIIGLLLYIKMFVNPLKKLNPIVRNKITIYNILLVGCSLAHRTAVPFIFLGLIVASTNLVVRTKISNAT